MDALAPELFTALLAALLVAAVLYATSGHGGATAYLALFGLWGLAPAEMKPLALVMNVVVAGVGVVRLWRAAALPPRSLIVPLLLGSLPAVWFGGLVVLPATTYRALLGVCLLLAAVRLWMPSDAEGPRRHWPAAAFFVVGVVLGFLSGLTGIGGGIFLSPLLILLRLEEPKKTAAAAAAFIVVNSLVGLAAQWKTGGLAHLPAALPIVIGIVFVGGIVGSYFAAHKLAPLGLRRALGVVLVVSGVKLVSEALA